MQYKYVNYSIQSMKTLYTNLRTRSGSFGALQQNILNGSIPKLIGIRLFILMHNTSIKLCMLPVIIMTIFHILIEIRDFGR